MKIYHAVLIFVLAFVGAALFNCSTTTPPTRQEQAAIGAAEQIALSYLSAYAAKGGTPANQQAYINMATGAILAAYPAVPPAQATQIATTTFKK